MNCTEILRKIKTTTGYEPRRSGKGWQCRCPGHADRQASLSVSTGDDGRILLHCHAGCPTESVVAALGVAMADLMPPKNHNGYTPPRAAAAEKPKRFWAKAGLAAQAICPENCVLEKLYDYREPTGTIYAAVVRYKSESGKEIRQLHCDNGLWYAGGPNHQWMPFRCETVKPDTQVIHITEGEKCCLALAAFGFTAVTSAGGALNAKGTNWGVLSGKKIFLWPDNDPPGVRYANQIAGYARDLGASEIRMVNLPGLAEHGDIADYIAEQKSAGLDDIAIAELLDGFIRTAPYWQPTETGTVTAAAATDDADDADEGDGTPTPPEPPLLDSPMFYGLAGDVVKALDAHTESSPIAVLIHTLTAFGNVIGRSAHFTVDGATHHTNLFTVCVGSTSKGRKGTALAQVMRLLDGVDNAWMKDCVKSGVSSGEGLLFAVRDPVEKEVQIKSKGHFTGETQIEIVDTGIDDKRLLTIEAEFGKVLTVCGRDGSTLSAQIRLAWDSGNLNVLTKTPLKATGAHISAIGHITAAELKTDLKKTDALNGFGNRFIWAYVERSKLLPRGGNLSESDLTPLRDRLNQAVIFATAVGEIGMTDDAWQIWDTVYPSLSAGADGLFGGMTSRAESQVRRLAMIYALLDCRDTVDAPHLWAALDLWAYAESTCRYLFGETKQSTSDPAADLVQWIKSRGGKVTARELARGRSCYRGSGAAEAGLQELVNSGLGRWLSQDTDSRGRPANMFVLAAGAAVPVTEMPKIKEKTNCVTVTTVTAPKNTVPATPETTPELPPEIPMQECPPQAIADQLDQAAVDAGGDV